MICMFFSDGLKNIGLFAQFARSFCLSVWSEFGGKLTPQSRQRFLKMCVLNYAYFLYNVAGRYGAQIHVYIYELNIYAKSNIGLWRVSPVCDCVREL